MTLPLHEYVLALIECLALAALLVRLVLSGLARVYKCFFGYLLADLVHTGAALLNLRPNLYFYVFLCGEAIVVFFYILIVFELYSVLFRGLPGIAKVAQRFTIAALAFSVLMAMVLRTVLPSPGTLLERFFSFEAAIAVSIVVFMLLITAFLAYYPIPLNRNAVSYSIGYAIYFLSKAAILFLNNAGSSAWLRAWSTVAIGVSTACVIFWAVSLNREGEKRTVVVGHRWSNVGAQEKVLKRLHELNDSLAQARGD